MEFDGERTPGGVRGVLVDANLLVLLVVGSADRELIGRVGRTDNYTGEDFDLVLKFLRPFGRVVATPQVLAELTNLLSLPRRDPYGLRVLSSMIQVLAKATEEYVPKDVMLGKPEVLCRIGFTDLSLMEAAQGGYPVLTADRRCADELRAAGCSVMNFNELRQSEWNS